jgi:hypothetical protein
VPLAALRATVELIHDERGPKEYAVKTVAGAFSGYTTRKLYELQMTNPTYPAELDGRAAALRTLLPYTMQTLGFSNGEIKIAIASISSGTDEPKEKIV